MTRRSLRSVYRAHVWYRWQFSTQAGEITLPNGNISSTKFSSLVTFSHNDSNLQRIKNRRQHQ